MKQFERYLEEIQRQSIKQNYLNFYVLWDNDGVTYEFNGYDPCPPETLKFLGYSLEDSKKILKYCGFLRCKNDYPFYDMLYFNIKDYSKIQSIIEPNKYLKFKNFDGEMCKWIFNKE
jgi:hypothetical protein